MKNLTKWVIDPAHSELQFKVKHMMITNINGEFRNFDASVETVDDDFTKGRMHVVIDATSVFTNNTDRDNHLKSPDFFDAEHFQNLEFEGTSIKKLDEENFQLKGLLTIKGVQKPVVLDMEYGGIQKDPWGNEKAGFTLSGKINRKEWGLNWNAALEAGGVLVSEDVKINAEIQLKRA